MAKKTDAPAAVLATDVYLHDDDHATPELFIAGTPAVELPEWAFEILVPGHPVWAQPEAVEGEPEPTVEIQVG